MNYLFEAVHAARSLAFPAISTSVITSTLVRAWCVFRNEIIPLRPQMRATCATIYSPITRLHRPKGQRLCPHKPNGKRIQRLERTLSVTSFPFFASNSSGIFAQRIISPRDISRFETFDLHRIKE